MNYLGELRKPVGHRPLLTVGATVPVADPENRLLLLKRSDDNYGGPPGGATEPGESLEETARREVFEEAGLKIENIVLSNVFSGKEQEYRYPNGDKVHIVTVVYPCRDFSGEVQLSNEHIESGWFGLSEMPEGVSPVIKPIFEQFKKSSVRT